jgi:hypothetical protein
MIKYAGVEFANSSIRNKKFGTNKIHADDLVLQRIGLGFALTARNQKFNSFCNPLPVIWDSLILPNELISRQGPEIKQTSR